MGSIEKPTQLSLGTALRLFDLKIAPVASYGIQIIWEHLTAPQLERVLGVPLHTRNHLVYLTTDSCLFIEDLLARFYLPKTTAFQEFLKNAEIKMSEVDPTFFTSAAMTSLEWRGLGQPNRHLITRFSTHGFHYAICTKSSFHEPEEGCRCRFCDRPCPLYHAGDCIKKVPLHRLSEWGAIILLKSKKDDFSPT